MTTLKVGKWEVSCNDQKVVGFVKDNHVILLNSLNNKVVVLIGIGHRESDDYISYKQNNRNYFLVVDYEKKSISVLQERPYSEKLREFEALIDGLL